MPGNTEAQTSAGTTIHVSAALPASITKTAYAALTYTKVGEVSDGGAVGRTYKTVEFTALDSRGTRKLKGSFDDGTMALQVGYAPGDAGQAILATALDDDDFYAFKVILQSGVTKYFLAQVISDPVNIGSVDSVTMGTVNLSIKSGSLITALPS
jgi:hypothetical protein